jgi:D-alanine-D-alanine ligase
MKRVVVLLGGPSAERDVSLVSGKACADGLRQAGYDVREVDVSRDVVALVKALEPRPDVVFNALHGRFGEDGCVQGILNLLGIPYTHSGLLASALAMDKPMAKRVFAANNIRCPDGKVVDVDSLSRADPVPRPYVFKPTHEGSSVGVTIVRKGDNKALPTREQWRFGSAVLVERLLPAANLTVAAGRPAANRHRAEVPQRFHDYEAKHTGGKTDHVIPGAQTEGRFDEGCAPPNAPMRRWLLRGQPLRLPL